MLGAGAGAGANCGAAGAGRVWGAMAGLLTEGAGPAAAGAGRKASCRATGVAEGAGVTDGLPAGREETFAFGMTMVREIGAADCGGAD